MSEGEIFCAEKKHYVRTPVLHFARPVLQFALQSRTSGERYENFPTCALATLGARGFSYAIHEKKNPLIPRVRVCVCIAYLFFYLNIDYARLGPCLSRMCKIKLKYASRIFNPGIPLYQAEHFPSACVEYKIPNSQSYRHILLCVLILNISQLPYRGANNKCIYIFTSSFFA